jgi:integrase/recombinase XerD
MKHLTIDEIYGQFKRFNAAKSLELETVEHYDRAYCQLKSFMDEKELRYFTKLTQNDWFDIMLWLQRDDRKPVTVNTYLRGMRRLVNFSAEEFSAPRLKPVFMKAREEVRPAYPQEQVLRIIKAPKRYGFKETRGWALTCFLLYSSLREKSVLNIRINDIDFISGEFFVRQLKNGQVIILPFAETITHIIKTYLEVRSDYLRDNGLSDSGYLFIRNSGEKMSRYVLYDVQKKFNESRGVNQKGVHVFRNTFAKLMTKNKSDLFTLQKWMTHNSVKSTKRYLDMYTRDLFDTVYEYNPIEKMREKIFRKML